MTESRTKSSIRNVIYSTGTYGLTLALAFITRYIFIKLLSTEYLGLNGLFSNVLSFLALAELGIGSAMNYTLYKPLKENNIDVLKALMRLYSKVYKFIGVVIIVLGICVSPFLPFLIKELPQDIDYLQVYFILYVINSGASYFYTYKKAMIICDQKEYITSVCNFVFSVILSILQIIILIFTKNYGMYLFVMIVCTLLENVVMSYIANKLYPYLKEKDVVILPKEYLKNIKKNILAMFFHKIGNVVVFATDNIIISKFVGIVSVGLYSNYTMVVNQINTLLGKVFNSLIASVGNLVLSDDKKHTEEVLNKVIFANSLLYGFCAICLLELIQPFIKVWLGTDYLLSNEIILIVVLNFYISGMRKSVLTFRTAAGLFWEDRYKPVIESILNILFSIPLAINHGIIGVLLGTITSTLLVPFWYEAYVLYHYYFQKSIWGYMYKQICYFVKFIIAEVAVHCLLSSIIVNHVWGFIVRLTLCVFFSGTILIILNIKDKNLKYFFLLIKDKVILRK